MEQEKREPPPYEDSYSVANKPTTEHGDNGPPPPQYMPPAQPYPTSPPQLYPAGQQTAVYMVQPPGATVIVRQPTGRMPDDHMIFAILVTVCCCLPCGIVAIMKASETKNRWYAGDVEGANHYSKEAKKWAMISLISGIVTVVSIVVIIIIYFTVILSTVYELY